MRKIKVSERDGYLLLLGVLFAFILQVAYEMLIELFSHINLLEMGIQGLLVGIIAIVSIWMIAYKLETGLEQKPENAELKEDRNKPYKIKVSILGLISVEKEIKDNEQNSERELQIDLAKIQNDIQIWLGLFLGCFAVAGAFLVGGLQLKPYYSYLSYVSAFVFLMLGLDYGYRLAKKRKELNSLT